jgi:hypothetical protein
LYALWKKAEKTQDKNAQKEKEAQSKPAQKETSINQQVGTGYDLCVLGHPHPRQNAEAA